MVDSAAFEGHDAVRRRPNAEATMKTFEELFEELAAKAKAGDPASGTVKELQKGVHFIGKKLTEEAAESWMAAEYEGNERTAEEISQLLYHAQVMLLAKGMTLADVYKHL